MKNLILLSLISLCPLVLLAQPSEYVKDNRTKTVVPIPQEAVKSSRGEQSAAATTSADMPIVSTASPLSDSLVSNEIINSKSVVEPVEEIIDLMRFEKKTVHFGTVKFGEHPSHIFYFKNTGQEPTTIELVSACDCTDVEYSKAPIPVGSTGFVKATYMSERAPEAINKSFNKEITIILKNTYPNNGYPIVETLKIKGDVVEQ